MNLAPVPSPSPPPVRPRSRSGITTRTRASGARLLLAAILAALPVTRPAGADWDRYLWETPVTEVPRDEAAQPLIDALRREIDRILEAGHLAPLRFSGADQVAEGFYLYAEPGRILLTLGYAYPYLDPERRTRVRGYVQSELADPRFVPWARESTLPPGVGTRREAYAMDRDWQWDWARQRAESRPRVAPLYGLWLLTWQGAAAGVAATHWTEIRAFYETHRAQAGLYGTLGAHLAMARLANLLRDEATERLAVDRARTVFEDGRSIDTMVNRMKRAYARQYDPLHGRGLANANWFFLDLVPEAGRYLHDHLRDPVLQRHRALLNTFPHWWVYRPWYASGWTGHESAGLPPEILGMIFPIERWVVKAPPEVLTEYQPGNAVHGLGDCHALEALVSTLSSFNSERWVDVRNAAPERSPPP